MREIVVTDADRARTVTADVGDILLIKLPESPTTGYRWSPVAWDAGILESKSDGFSMDVNAAVGGGGLRVFRFLVKGKGDTRVQFELVRAWAPQSPSATFDMQVSVGP